MPHKFTFVLLSFCCLLTNPLNAESSKATSQELAEIKAELGAIKGDLAEVKDSLSQIADAFQRSAMRGKNVNEVKFTPSTSSEDDYAIGDPKAPVLVMEFVDFQCGFCARYAKATFPAVKREYIDSGKVRYVFRDFPLQMHTHALQAASVAACAQQQGKFLEMHNALFDHAEEVNEGDFESIYQGIAGLDQAKIKTCLESGPYRVNNTPRGIIPSLEVQDDMKEGGKLGVSATPSFFVGKNREAGSELKGVLVRGSQSFDTFKEVINDYLD